MSRPIQVFLNTKQFLTVPTSRARGGNKDFFKGDDRGFSRHKSVMRQKIHDASETMRKRSQNAGFVIVQMRNEALAKSYRPLNDLFSTTNLFSLVGGGGIGEMIFQCSPNALDQLDRRIEERAELNPKEIENKNTGELESRPSTCRSELGGIEDIRLPTPADRVSFSAREAVAWLSRKDTFDSYVVELFQPDPNLDSGTIKQMIEEFHQRLLRLGGVVALPLFSTESSNVNQDYPGISIKLTREIEQSFINLPLGDVLPAVPELQRAASFAQLLDNSVGRHQKFLEQMAVEPLVRRVNLPPSIGIIPLSCSQQGQTTELPLPPPKHSAPVVGIIDGGVADIPTLSPWCAGSSGLIEPSDRDSTHGTFIAGLIAGARTLNPRIGDSLETGGCHFYDIPLLPRQDLISDYFTDLSEFIDQLKREVIRAKSDADVRIFNLSLGSPGLRSGLGYSAFAKALDSISIELDVLFVVSAGNLSGTGVRAPWPSDGNLAVRLLARGATNNERIIPPAEHLLGLSVGALNPPGIPKHVVDLPTTYTRRGPGVGGARKPDLSHYGGVLQSNMNETGLISIATDGTDVSDAGTSYATPLVASTAATINHRLEGKVPRETLIALLIHRAQRCNAMQHAALSHIAHEFIGFGMAPPSDVCLSDRSHSITLVFSESLGVRRALEFVFSWPKSLVTNSGKCRGRVDLTLAFVPPIDARFDAECLRVQLDAFLQQIEIDSDSGNENPQSRLSRQGGSMPSGLGYSEKHLLKNGLKWTPVKRYGLSMPNGRGSSSTWRLVLKSSTRAGEVFPESGVPFTIVMTISDLQKSAPVYDEVRNEIISRGLELADITVAHRVRSRL